MKPQNIASNPIPDPTIIDRLRKQGNAKKEEERRTFAPETVIEPLFSWQGVGRFLDQEPKPQEWVLDKCLPAKVVGAIFATGGVGKTSLALQLSACMATGTPFGPFIPTKPMKVLFIGGEDSEDIFHCRIFRAVPAMGMKASGGNIASAKENLLRRNLEVVSLVGTDRFITELDQAGNPRTTKVFQRLQETIRGIDGLDVLIIDPKSRFDGLNENDNSHATYFISCLEKLVGDHGITVLFSHHESKAQVKDGEVKTSSGRGASALRDGVRWALSLGEMGEKEAEKYDVDAGAHIEAAISKNNYGPKWGNTTYFRRDQDGVLFPANLHSERVDAMAEELVRELVATEHQFTERELSRPSDNQERSKAGKEIAERLADKFNGFKRGVDMRRAIEKAKFRGLVTEEEVPAGKKPKLVLSVPDETRARFASDLAEKEIPQEEPAENASSKKTGKKGQKNG